MNREIKFRAMKDDMSDPNFVYGMLIYDTDGVTPRIQVKYPTSPFLFYTCLKGTEGQFTGLKDKNGNEVYEGDVIEIDGYHANRKEVVEYDHIQNCGCCDDIMGIGFDMGTHGTYSVIGNIYENPELLQK